MAVKDLLRTEDLIRMAEALRIALGEVNSRRAVQRELGFSNREVIEIRELTQEFVDTVNRMDPKELDRELKAEEEGGDVVIKLHRYLTPADFLIGFEVARLLLGDKLRREWILEGMDMTDEDADLTWRHINTFMNAVREVQRKVDAPKTGPALPAGGAD